MSIPFNDIRKISSTQSLVQRSGSPQFQRMSTVPVQVYSPKEGRANVYYSSEVNCEERESYFQYTPRSTIPVNHQDARFSVRRSESRSPKGMSKIIINSESGERKTSPLIKSYNYQEGKEQSRFSCSKAYILKQSQTTIDTQKIIKSIPISKNEQELIKKSTLTIPEKPELEDDEIGIKELMKSYELEVLQMKKQLGKLKEMKSSQMKELEEKVKSLTSKNSQLQESLHSSENELRSTLLRQAILEDQNCKLLARASLGIVAKRELIPAGREELIMFKNKNEESQVEVGIQTANIQQQSRADAHQDIQKLEQENSLLKKKLEDARKVSKQLTSSNHALLRSNSKSEHQIKLLQRQSSGNSRSLKGRDQSKQRLKSELEVELTDIISQQKEVIKDQKQLIQDQNNKIIKLQNRFNQTAKGEPTSQGLEEALMRNVALEKKLNELREVVDESIDRHKEDHEIILKLTEEIEIHKNGRTSVEEVKQLKARFIELHAKLTQQKVKQIEMKEILKLKEQRIKGLEGRWVSKGDLMNNEITYLNKIA